jgi:hypothetical protein
MEPGFHGSVNGPPVLLNARRFHHIRAKHLLARRPGRNVAGAGGIVSCFTFSDAAHKTATRI